MLEYVEAHYIGVLLLAIMVLTFGTWIAWLFSVGRYKGTVSDSDIVLALVDFTSKIIDGFRHLLALLLVLTFVLALAYAMYLATTLNDLTIALQLVMSSMGGLVCSIVGLLRRISGQTGLEDQKSR